MTRSVSVVICTYNRAPSLSVTLSALRHLDHEQFEVIVVAGPCTDHTDDVLAAHGDDIKVVRTRERNLSHSRNLGIAAAAGELVAFLDDDAYPDADWLDHLVTAFADPEVAVAGGPTLDHTGTRLQAMYSIANREGDAWVADGPDPSGLFCAPGTDVFPYAIGTNAAFRRDVLVGMGGFDEEYEYYLDETDVCLRLVDAGWVVATGQRGLVYHKFLSSDVRTPERAIRDRYSVVKNRAYFALRHAHRPVDVDQVLDGVNRFVDRNRWDYLDNIARGLLTEEDREQFERDVAAAIPYGLRRALHGAPRVRPPAWYDGRRLPFVRFTTLRPAGGRLRVVFVCREHPPDPLNGIGRFIHVLATQLGRRGHYVHVIALSRTHDRVDFEDHHWVHRVTPVPVTAVGDDIDVLPPDLRQWSEAALAELRRIDHHRPVDVVHLGNWDCEGAAVIRAGEHRTLMSLYTPLRTVMALDPAFREDDPTLQSIVTAERALYGSVTAYLASGTSVVEEVESGYGVALDRGAVAMVPYGLPDVTASAPAPAPADGGVEVLFVGRLEYRKGIDTLLDAVPAVLARCPDVSFTIAGDDRLVTPSGLTFRQEFERSDAGRAAAGRVRFLGRVSEQELTDLYARCDLFVAPSRYESFGLILVEAMRFGKPVIGGDAGGMRDIMSHGEFGVLVPPGDGAALAEAIVALAGDAAARADLGRAGRAVYEQVFSADAMTDQVVDVYRRLVDGSLARDLGDRSGERQLGMALAEVSRCTACGGPAEAQPRVVTTDGLLKEGSLHCAACGSPIAAVENFKYHYGAPVTSGAGGPVTVVPPLGERRLPAARLAPWAFGAWGYDGQFLISDGSPDSTVCVTARCTDAVVRLRDHPLGGHVDLVVDGETVATVDTRSDSPQVRAYRILADGPYRSRTIVVRPAMDAVTAASGCQLVVEELVLLGPIGPGLAFADPRPINRGNPESPAVQRYLAHVPDSAWILECGGGDRRGHRPRHVNFEYLDYELADAYGDSHDLPFLDETFDFVFTQAVFEHVRQPFDVARELVRVTRPGGLIVSEVAFLQPLHAVPYHYFNMTLWGVEELFSGCEIVEADWFGGVADSIDWILRAASLDRKASAGELAEIVTKVKALETRLDHADLKAVASGVYLVVRKPLPTQPEEPTAAIPTTGPPTVLEGKSVTAPKE